MEALNGGNRWQPSEQQQELVQAGPEKWLLVVAGPGTGKTQVAALRLLHLIRSGVQPAQILVLSFSRSSVTTLTKRLQSLSPEDEASLEDLRHLAIRTFDAWAFRVLRQGGATAAELLSHSHDENIALVKVALEDSSDDSAVERLSHIRHVIVDEFQDLPGVRSDMVLSLLSRLNTPGKRPVGFTVLGDPIQAIYGFANRASAEATAVSPWDQLKRRFEPQLSEVILDRNFRSVPHLADMAGSLRKILGSPQLPPDKKLEAMRRLLERLPSSTADAMICPQMLREMPEGSLAILTRTNGEALRVWQSLLGKSVEGPGVAVQLRLAGALPVVPAWISVLLSKYKNPTISSTVFRKVFESTVTDLDDSARKSLGFHPADVSWRRLTRASGVSDAETVIDLAELRSRLDWPDSFPDDQSGSSDAVFITTIHQSKGMEFDNVALLEAQERDEAGSSGDDLEEAFVAFVAVTRAGRQLGRLPSSSIYKPPKVRSFRQNRSRLASWGKMANFQIGLPGDLDSMSFVDPDLHGGVQQVHALQQELMVNASNWSGHKVVLHKVILSGQEDGKGGEVRYDVRLQLNEGEGRLLGRTSEQLTWDLLDFLWKAGYSLPKTIYNLRIASVVTTGFDGEGSNRLPEPWRSSGLWLGLSLLGTGDFKMWKRNGK
ncbi:UvrD-helicase domain-containing protein [Hydrogenophaga sp.]|uniref:UvrD-helicase domain-containing protein n=1 Tax=Hydrogenophaga sp. TaxID=1904254 RepID=UPI002732B754|nr:UvrD-helicase domain-containing protein [Hydrogenophaga sp.]MDP3883670.1 UvrD-helicase domain-containing protein [Hydrogenophaga sp.]